MKTISIIGSDSFIATNFYNSYNFKKPIKLFSRIHSGKPNEIVKNLFEITQNDFINVDVILNFAAIVHQPNLKDEALFKKVNTELPIHLATEAKKAGAKHFIQMSTIAVYGNVTQIDEKTAEQPNNLYGVSKLAADNALLAMQDENFSVTIIRPPMVYGGGIAPGNLKNLIKVAQKGFPMPFKGVKNKRDFIHVGNLVEVLNLVVTNSIFEVVIPTDKKPVSTEEILVFIKKYSKKKVFLIKIPKFFHVAFKSLKPSIYNKVFGDLIVECNVPNSIYMPNRTFEDGISQMIIN